MSNDFERQVVDGIEGAFLLCIKGKLSRLDFILVNPFLRLKNKIGRVFWTRLFIRSTYLYSSPAKSKRLGLTL